MSAQTETLTLQQLFLLLLLCMNPRFGDTSRDRTSYSIRQLLYELQPEESCCEDRLNAQYLLLEKRGLVNGRGTGDQTGPQAPPWAITKEGAKALADSPLLSLFKKKLAIAEEISQLLKDNKYVGCVH